MMRTEHEPQNTIVPAKKSLWLLFVVLIISIVGVFSLLTYVNTPPEDFPTSSTFVIPEGSSVGEIGLLLKNEHYIRSLLYFKFIVRTSFNQPLIQAGNYTFATPLTTRSLIESLTEIVSLAPQTAVTFPEGFSVHNINEYTSGLFSEVDSETLQQYEGYLFPETYFVSSSETFESLMLRMQAEYEKNIEPLRAQIVERGFTEKEVIIMASILEREANDETSMRMVSGVLQNRLRENIPLQVDAVFAYILGKTSAELTLDDLAIESPYNTYIHTGLPPTPIANPGRMAIEAVLNPTPSSYYFYLTGSDGNFYYAQDFDEHKRNKARYLN